MKKISLKLVSLILPIYNVEQYLDRCLKSVSEQTYKNLEILLLNDGSTDSSGEICQKWAEKDTRMIYIEKINEGQGPTRDLGIQMARGECILFLDPDDWVEPEFVEALVQPILTGQADMTVCDYRQVWCDEQDEVIRERKFKARFSDMTVIDLHQNKDYLFTMESFLWNKGYKSESLKSVLAKQGTNCHEDTAVCFLYCYKARYILPVKKCLYHYRQRPGSSIYSDQLYNRVWKTMDVMKENILQYAPELLGEYAIKRIAARTALCCRSVKGETREAQEVEQHFREVFLTDAEKDIGDLNCCIFGSFNLRCIVNFLEYFPPPYFGFSGLISAMSPEGDTPLSISHKNPFRQSALEADCQKTFFDKLGETEYLFLDLLEERFPVMELADGSWITGSDAFEEAEYQGVEILRTLDWKDAEWESLWKESADRLINRIQQSNIRKVVLLQTRLAESRGAYGREEPHEDLEEIRAFNGKLVWMEQYLMEQLEQCIVIRLPEELVYTDTAFAFGCVPWHLNERVYGMLALEMKRRIEGEIAGIGLIPCV